MNYHPNKNFYIGVVEDRDDPNGLGACRVRVLGVHSENKELVPVEALPWAMALTPDNQLAIPKLGDWVLISFLDGDFDYPVRFGTIPGMMATEVVKSNLAGQSVEVIGDTKSQTGFKDPRTVEQKQQEPKPKDGVVTVRPGQPSLGVLATVSKTKEGLENSIVELMNLEKNVICTISPEVRANILKYRLNNSVLVQKLRAEAQELLDSLVSSPAVQEITAFIQYITRQIAELRRIIDEINAILLELLEIVQLIQLLIQWLLSLPARLKAYFLNCIAEFTALLGEFLSISGLDLSGTNNLFGAIGSLITETSALVVTAETTVVTVEQISNGVQSIGDSFEKV